MELSHLAGLPLVGSFPKRSLQQNRRNFVGSFETLEDAPWKCRAYKSQLKLFVDSLKSTSPCRFLLPTSDVPQAHWDG